MITVYTHSVGHAFNTESPVLKSSAGLEIRSERVYEPENDMVNASPPIILKSLFVTSVGRGVCDYCRQPPTPVSLRGNLITAFGLRLTPATPAPASPDTGNTANGAR